MPVFTVRYSQEVFYEMDVEADDAAGAIARAQRGLCGGDEDMRWDGCEVDSGDHKVIHARDVAGNYTVATTLEQELEKADAKHSAQMADLTPDEDVLPPIYRFNLNL